MHKTTPPTTPRNVSDHERRCYHAVSLALESNYHLIRKLYEKHDTWGRAWHAIAGAHQNIDADAAWDALSRSGIMLMLPTDATFPKLLTEIPWPSFGLYVLGSPKAIEHTPRIAIVGTRKATGDGRSLAREFSEVLARHGVCIVSGLAFGIDAAAHEGTLAAGGTTIAILATGLDTVYPKSHAPLARRIMNAGGALISEYPPGTPALPYRFLERNRIVSGLAEGTLIIEAPERSGSIATARFALEQNRTVFVVPGPVRYPNYVGSNRLIREGAELVTAPSDILEELSLAPTHHSEFTEPTTEPERTVFRALATHGGPVSIDKIAEATHLEVRVVSQTLSLLTLGGYVTETEVGYTISRNQVG